MSKRIKGVVNQIAESSIKNTQREEDIAYWKQFWPDLQKAASESEEHVDKKVFALSAGAIGLEVTLLSLPYFNEAKCLCLAGSAAICFVISLCVNLLIHIKGWKNQDNESKVINDFIQSKPDAFSSDKIYALIERHGTNIRRWNIFSSVILIIGIVLLFSFTFLNLLP